MGKLVLHITKSREVIKATSGLFSWTQNPNDSKTYNPSSGYIDLQSLNFGFNAGINADLSANLTLERPRATAGNKLSIPLTLTCSYLKSETPTQLVDAVSYLFKASMSGYIGLLYWIPNSDDEIQSGQAQDYYTSITRVLQEVEWDGAKISHLDAGYSGTTVDLLALPVLVTNADVLQTAGTNEYSVNITLQLIVQED